MAYTPYSATAFDNALLPKLGPYAFDRASMALSNNIVSEQVPTL